MDRHTRITSEQLLYGVIFVSALLVRLMFLGRPALLESEAHWAYQAWGLARGEYQLPGSRVGYLAVTQGLFSLFGGSDFLARLWPAFTGSLIVGIPYLLRKRVPPVSALVLAGGLALDPALVALSRTAGSPVPALVFLGLALAAFHTCKFSEGILFVGLGLLSGPDFWLGILLIVLGTLVGNLTSQISVAEYYRVRLKAWKDQTADQPHLLMAPILVLGLLATLFLTNFQGLSAWAGAVPEFVTTITHPHGISPLLLVIGMLVSNPLALIFGILGFIAAWREENRLGRISSIWFAVAILLLMVYPDRQLEDLIWTFVPLWMAAAWELIRIYRIARDSWVTYSFAGLVSVLAALNWLTFSGLVFQGGNDRAVYLQLGLLGASVMLLILSMTIVSSEWNGRMARKGLAVGVGATLVLYLISSLTLDAFRWEKDPRSLYAGGVGSGQMELLRESIADASLTATGRPDSITGTVIDGTDLLRWTLRDFSQIEFAAGVDSSTPAPLLITAQDDFGLVDGDLYRGQDFVLSTRPDWDGLLPADWISWIGYRLGPIRQDYLVLWIRNDINSGY